MTGARVGAAGAEELKILGKRREALTTNEDKHRALIARVRAAVEFISPDDITPMGARVLDRILDEEEAAAPEEPVAKTGEAEPPAWVQEGW